MHFLFLRMAKSIFMLCHNLNLWKEKCARPIYPRVML